MKFQFATKSLLLATAVSAIVCGGVMSWSAHQGFLLSGSAIAYGIGFNAPLWLPFAYLAYLVGCQKLTQRSVVVFAIAQAVACGISYLSDIYL